MDIKVAKLKILFRKNLNMSPGKLAAQAVHAALGVTKNPMLSVVVVLGVSDKKFEEAKETYSGAYVVRDAGYTEVPPGTETCMAFLVEEIVSAEIIIA